MAYVSTMHKYFALDPACEAALLLLQITVAAALTEVAPNDLADMRDEHRGVLSAFDTDVEVDTYVESLANGTSHWRQALAEAVEDEREGTCDDPTHGLMLLLELCTTSVVTDPELLEESNAVRRLDTVLDILGADLWCGDVRANFVEAAEILVGESNTDWRPAALAGARTASQALGFFHPFLGMAAGAVLAWTNVDQAAASGTTSAPVLARVLATCALSEEKVQKTLVPRAKQVLVLEMDKVARRIDSSSLATDRRASLQGLQRAQSNALQFLAALVSDAPATAVTQLPSLVGQPLKGARAIIAAVTGDMNVEAEDAVKPMGTAREIWSEKNWFVVAQEQLAAGNVRLLVRKTSD